MKRINLIPPEFTTGKKTWVETGLWRYAAGAGLLVGVGIAVHLAVAFSTLSVLKHGAASLRRKINAGEASAQTARESQATLEGQLKNLDKKVKALEKKENRLKRFQKKPFSWSDALRDFKEQIPEKAWIDELVLMSPRTTESRVLGGGFSNKEVSVFLDRLNASKYFENASFVRTEAGELNREKIIRFELTFDMTQTG